MHVTSHKPLLSLPRNLHHYYLVRYSNLYISSTQTGCSSSWPLVQMKRATCKHKNHGFLLFLHPCDFISYFFLLHLSHNLVNCTSHVVNVFRIQAGHGDTTVLSHVDVVVLAEFENLGL